MNLKADRKQRRPTPTPMIGRNDFDFSDFLTVSPPPDAPVAGAAAAATSASSAATAAAASAAEDFLASVLDAPDSSKMPRWNARRILRKPGINLVKITSVGEEEEEEEEEAEEKEEEGKEAEEENYFLGLADNNLGFCW